MTRETVAAAGEYLTVFECAELLRVTPRTIRNWIRSEALRVHRAGRRVLIARESIEVFLRS